MVSMKNPLAAILDSNRFTGLNYQDWLRNLNLVLASEKLLYTIEKSPPEETPANISPEELITLNQWRLTLTRLPTHLGSPDVGIGCDPDACRIRCIVVEDSPLADMHKMSYTEHMRRSKAYTAASIITHAQSKAVKQAHIRTSIILSYNYNKEVPSNTDLTPAEQNTKLTQGPKAQKLRIGSYELYQNCPSLLTQQKALKAQDYRREMSSNTSPASRKLPKAVPNEASQQEEYSATTLTSVRDATDNLRYKDDFPLRSESHIRYDLTPKQILTYSNDVAQSPLSYLDTTPRYSKLN
ncbi:hypothetical protein F511_27770 [Dorcoceras hygrometricum]|uniref:Uncharacterized protein n=1 Tax=Dorcoceras hygrometricum TaxID=472368 RepID=A0A2Z7AGL5_9LAMI|nr:hypothetical protein F511_27770 [Dorcoceras hygrometricum]